MLTLPELEAMLRANNEEQNPGVDKLKHDVVVSGILPILNRFGNSTQPTAKQCQSKVKLSPSPAK